MVLCFMRKKDDVISEKNVTQQIRQFVHFREHIMAAGQVSFWYLTCLNRLVMTDVYALPR